MIRVAVTLSAYFDDDINDEDRRTERLSQITEAVGGIKDAEGLVRSRIDSGADYVRTVTS